MKRRQAMQAPPPVSDEPVYTPFDFGSSGFVSSKNHGLASSNFHSNHGCASSGFRASAKQSPHYPPGYPKETYIPFFDRKESGSPSPPGKGSRNSGTPLPSWKVPDNSGNASPYFPDNLDEMTQTPCLSSDIEDMSIIALV
jgi:hypothetical protein